MADKKDKKAGRPSAYDPSFNDEAYNLCLLGYTDLSLARHFGVSKSTLNNWKSEFPDFLDSIKRGKVKADIEVVNALYDSAKGAEWVEEVAIKVKVSKDEERVEVVELHKAAPPNVTAIQFWLKNRQKKRWRDKQEHELSGKNGQPIQHQHSITPEDVEAFKTFFDKKY